MTTTTLINAATVGVTPTAASNFVTHTFAATSGAFNLQASLTSGALASFSRLTVHYAPVMDNVAAALASVGLTGPASFSFAVTARTPLTEYLFTTDIEGCRGRYLFVWLEEPLLGSASTLTLKVTEY